MNNCYKTSWYSTVWYILNVCTLLDSYGAVSTSLVTFIQNLSYGAVSTSLVTYINSSLTKLSNGAASTYLVKYIQNLSYDPI